MEALRIWRLFPTQIESDLPLHYRRSIAEWHSGQMRSRELLVLLDGLPDTSKFKEATERSFRIVEYTGEDTENVKKGDLLRMRMGVKPPADVTVVGEYVDWTFDRKLLARNVREVIAQRSYAEGIAADFTHLMEPLEEFLAQQERQKRADMIARARSHVARGIYAYEKR